jgi:tetratricopeptide (TPR) repeat protein
MDEDLDEVTENHGESHSHSTHQHVHHGDCCSHDHSDERLVYYLPVATKLASCDAFRLEGIYFFQETQWGIAKRRFQKILVYLDYTFPNNEEDEKRAAELRKMALTNMMICSLRLEEYREAISLASQVLREWPATSKALFCRAKARRLLGDYDEARKDLKECLRLIPNNIDAVEELQMVDSDERVYEGKSAQLARGMFSRASHDHEESMTSEQGEKLVYQ